MWVKEIIVLFIKNNKVTNLFKTQEQRKILFLYHQPNNKVFDLMMEQINLQVTAPNEKVVGLEMTVEVKLPDGRPVKVKLKPEVRPNETIVVPVSLPDNTKSNNTYVYSNDANVSILNDGDDMLESGMMNMQQDAAPFSKEIFVQ